MFSSTNLSRSSEHSWRGLVEEQRGVRFEKVAIIGLGLIGSSIARAVEEALSGVTVRGFDADDNVSKHAAALHLAEMAETSADAVTNADLVILCTPVGAMAEAANSIAPHLKDGAIVTDVGSSKTGITMDLQRISPNAHVVPAHPVAGTENSGPEAGFAGLFRGC